MKIISPGFLTTIQDLGRSAYLNQGFPIGGAMDFYTASLLNIILGNEEGFPVIEFCQTGPEILFHENAVVALGGDLKPKLDGIVQRPWTQIFVEKGQTLDCGTLKKGVWGYLGVSGGVNIPKFFDSASTHAHLGIGGLEGRALQVGDEFEVGEAVIPKRKIPFGSKGIAYEDQPRVSSEPIRCVEGAQWDWFTESSQEAFFANPFKVSPTSNRVGYRLDGNPLHRKEDRLEQEMSSEGALSGTVQVSNNGLPIVLMADSQLIGGYPKLAHVAKVDIGRFAQISAGEEVNFSLISHDGAIAHLQEQEREKAVLKTQIQIL